MASCSKKFTSKELSKDKQTERTWAHLLPLLSSAFAQPALPEQFLRRAFLSGVLDTSPSIGLCELFYMAWGLEIFETVFEVLVEQSPIPETRKDNSFHHHILLITVSFGGATNIFLLSLKPLMPTALRKPLALGV